MYVALILFITFLNGCISSPSARYSEVSDTLTVRVSAQDRVRIGAEELLDRKLSMLKGKKVGMLVNHTSTLPDGTFLLDTLLASGIQVTSLFGPEHGIRGDLDAGKYYKDGKDTRTGLPVVSLYGSKMKPSPADLTNVDIVVFDIQDVGTRFYTYLTTMVLMMEACAEQGKPMVILDRPNPNGQYTGGPVLKKDKRSYVGLHQVPIVHGMTLGEYALMVNGEGWLKGGIKCALSVISCTGYRHDMSWEQTGLTWVPPSPNLGTPRSARLYPILCWYEGTPMSVGRGTDSAFTVLGSPWQVGYHDAWKRDSALEQIHEINNYGLRQQVIRFRPVSKPGKSSNPLFKGQTCYGVYFLNERSGDSLFLSGLQVLKDQYEAASNTGYGQVFFKPYFDDLAGDATLKEYIKMGKTPEEILATWQSDLQQFRLIRSKYLQYP